VLFPASKARERPPLPTVPVEGPSRCRMRWTSTVRIMSLTVLVGCAISSCSGDDGTAAFAGQDRASAVLVQWAEGEDGALTGSIQIADKSPSPDGPPVKQTALVFTGKLDDDQVSLSVKDDEGSTVVWNGTMDDDDLRINVTRGAGGSQPLTLTRASPAAFTADVADLASQVQATRVVAARASAQAKAQADREAEVAALEKSFADARGSVTERKKALAQAVSDPSGLPALTQDLDEGRRDLKDVQRNADQAAIRSRGYLACGFASQAEEANRELKRAAAAQKRHAREVRAAADELAEAADAYAKAVLRLEQLSENSGKAAPSESSDERALRKQAAKLPKKWQDSAAAATATMKEIAAEADNLARNALNASC
jgi:hypothetical protein